MEETCCLYHDGDVNVEGQEQWDKEIDTEEDAGKDYRYDDDSAILPA